VSPRLSPAPRGFTLVELLVVITIISIMASIVMGGMSYGRQAARDAKTKTTIAKLNDIIMQKYESYLTRRVPIDTTGMTPNVAAHARLSAIRDLMRMEMPERWNDILNGPNTDPISNTSVPKPALYTIYLQQYNNVPHASGSNDSAKCLYMIVATSSPESMEQFDRSEIGFDGADTWPMFIDGWGTPIKFLRWAPGFNVSDIQPNITTSSWTDNSAGCQRELATTNDHDPLDPRRLDTSQPDNVTSNSLSTGWRLVPLIFSAGPDKQYDINDLTGYSYTGNPYSSGHDAVTNDVIGIGAPVSSNHHLDNIHNHSIEQR
jgi:prepilin-type N-terminal cleavage/methylation domain-containing protein